MNSYELLNKMVFSCCVITCRQKGGVKMHTFPYSIPELYSEWVKRIQRVDFNDMDPKKVATNYRICERHFSDFAKIGDQCRSRTGLKKFALPNLHLPGFKETPTKENSILSKNLIMDTTSKCVVDNNISHESSLTDLQKQDCQRKINKISTSIVKTENTFQDTSEMNLILPNLNENKLKENDVTKTLSLNNTEIFDENNVHLEMSGNNLTDFHKFASKENSLSPCTLIMDELFASYPKSGIDLHLSFETSLASLYLPDSQDNSIKENTILSSTMAIEESSHNSEHIFNTNEIIDTSLPILQLTGVEEITKKKAPMSLSDMTMEELFANNPEFFFDLNLPFDTNLPEIASFGFQELEIIESSNVSLDNLKRKAPALNDELRKSKQCRSALSNVLSHGKTTVQL